MAQKKGQTGNPNGRPKGTPNKVTTELRSWIAQLIDNNRDQLERDLKKLGPRERWAVIEKLMQYTIPRLQNVEGKFDLNNLTEEQLDIVIDRLLDEQKRKDQPGAEVKLW